jgi:hypothetical protein
VSVISITFRELLTQHPISLLLLPPVMTTNLLFPWQIPNPQTQQHLITNSAGQTFSVPPRRYIIHLLHNEKNGHITEDQTTQIRQFLLNNHGTSDPEPSTTSNRTSNYFSPYHLRTYYT